MTNGVDWYRQRVDYSVDGDIRFVGHRDLLRLFARAVVRARLPIRYSEGFNPHPRLSIPLPRTVGMASDAECLVFDLTEPVAESTVLHRLGEQVPRGLGLLRVSRLEPRQRLIPAEVTYHVAVAGIDQATVEARSVLLLDPSPIPVERTDSKSGRITGFDARPALRALEVTPDGVRMTLLLTEGATPRPAEIIAALGLQADAVNHRVRRLEIEWR